MWTSAAVKKCILRGLKMKESDAKTPLRIANEPDIQRYSHDCERRTGEG